MDRNSSKNQEIKRKFVGQHILCNVNTMVEYILSAGFEDRNAPFTVDDVENYYSYPEYRGDFADFDGGTEEQRQAEIDRLNEERDGSTDLSDYPDEINAEIEALEELETEAREVFEWWAVSSWLYGKLKENGQCVLDAGSCYVWGRTTTGQAILLDAVISGICEEMGILEGQENAWA